MLQELMNQPVALLVGAITGGVLGAVAVLVTWWLDRRARDVRELLRRGLEIQALKEAWIHEGTIINKRKFQRGQASRNRSLLTERRGYEEWRYGAVLYQARWNAPADNF